MRISRYCCGALLWFGMQSVGYAQAIEPPKSVTDSERDVSLTWVGYWTETDQDASGGSAGSTTTAVGQTITLEKRLSSAFEIGFDLLMEEQQQVSNVTPAGFPMPARLSKKSSEVNVFARYSHGPLTIEPNVRVGLDQYKLRRPDLATRLTGNSASDGYHWGAYLEMYLTLPLSETVFLRPIADFDYSYLSVDAFTESGAGPANIAFERVQDRRAVGQIGMAVAGRWTVGEIGTFMPFVNLKYRRNFITGPIQTHARLASGARDLGQQTLSNGQEKHGWTMDVGVILKGHKNAELWTVYRGQYFPSSTKHGLGALLKLSF